MSNISLQKKNLIHIFESDVDSQNVLDTAIYYMILDSKGVENIKFNKKPIFNHSEKEIDKLKLPESLVISLLYRTKSKTR